MSQKNHEKFKDNLILRKEEEEEEEVRRKWRRRSGRLGIVVVRALDLQSTGSGFDSWLSHCQAAIFLKLRSYGAIEI